VTAGRPGSAGKPGDGGVAGPAAAGGAPLLAIRDLAIDFGTPEEPQPAVRGIDLTVTQGSTLGIVGESGSGKSMSMLSVVSLLPDTARVSGSPPYTAECRSDPRSACSVTKAWSC
jgi:ABC-type glutathione transport system ATPase component